MTNATRIKRGDREKEGNKKARHVESKIKEEEKERGKNKSRQDSQFQTEKGRL